MAVRFLDVKSAEGLKKLDEYLCNRSFITGDQASKDDIIVYFYLRTSPSSSYVNASRWFNDIDALLRISIVSGDESGVVAKWMEEACVELEETGMVLLEELRKKELEKHNLIEELEMKDEVIEMLDEAIVEQRMRYEELMALHIEEEKAHHKRMSEFKGAHHKRMSELKGAHHKRMSELKGKLIALNAEEKAHRKLNSELKDQLIALKARLPNKDKKVHVRDE